MPKSMTAPISLEHHEQALADACEEMRKATAERCAEIAWARSQFAVARVIEEEFGLPANFLIPPPRRLKPRITIDPRAFEEDEESE